MTPAPLHSTPRASDVLREQIRAVALALRIPALVAIGLLVAGSALAIAEFVTSHGPVDFAPELSLLPGMLGALLPIGVWKAEDRFGAAFLWTLPVDRQRHALLKVGAGWVCLIGAVSAFVLWMLALALITGGNILGERVLLLLPSSVVPVSGSLARGALREVHWAPSPWLWLVPFTSATGTYALASAFTLGARHPLRWMIGAVLGLFATSALGAAAGVDWLRFAPAHLVNLLFESRYGLDTLLSARAESLSTAATLMTGETVGVWRGLPDLGDWAVATVVWIGVALVALWAAAARHREERGAERLIGSD